MARKPAGISHEEAAALPLIGLTTWHATAAIVDGLGLVLAVVVTAASVQDRDAAVPLLERLRAG
ncbi:hypothetical protein [Streptomyces sp. NPDC002671]